jgi:single-stranded-DNA-specific exonuclease
LGDGPVRASDLGFRLGPRINVAGRLAAATDIIELFDTRDLAMARTRAQNLDRLNRDRQGIQRKLVVECLAQLTDPTPAFCLLWGPEDQGWHRGVVGIVAARVRDTVHRPAAVVAVSGDEARGSVRSIPGMHAVQALDAASDLLVRYGGHPAAAGFTVAAANLPALAERLSAWAEKQHGQGGQAPVLDVDAVCTPSELDWKLCNALARIGPFGKGNPEPLLQLDRVHPERIGKMGERHLRFRLGALDCVWWRGTEFADALRQPVDLVGKLEVNQWQGRAKLRFTVSDARLASLPAS